MKILNIPSASGYLVSDSGEVYNARTWHRLKPQPGLAGYPKVSIPHNDGKCRTRYLHHLVAEAFIGPRPEWMDIDHIDGNPANNTVENLHYCTRRENQDNPNNKGPCYWQRLAMRRVVATRRDERIVFANASEAARILGLCLSGISNALSGKPVNKGYRNGRPRYCTVRTCGGYSFQFVA